MPSLACSLPDIWGADRHRALPAPQGPGKPSPFPQTHVGPQPEQGTWEPGDTGLTEQGSSWTGATWGARLSSMSSLPGSQVPACSGCRRSPALSRRSKAWAASGAAYTHCRPRLWNGAHGGRSKRGNKPEESVYFAKAIADRRDPVASTWPLKGTPASSCLAQRGPGTAGPGGDRGCGASCSDRREAGERAECQAAAR